MINKITDFYALSADYDKKTPITKEFFTTIQETFNYFLDDPDNCRVRRGTKRKIITLCDPPHRSYKLETYTRRKIVVH